MNWVSVRIMLPTEEETVLTYPNYNKCWYAKDWKVWCHNGSRDIVQYEITHWAYLVPPIIRD
jgi:hypothetical protein